MIINTGSRTDIPAFYSTWFMNRIKEGYVWVRNPYYPKQVISYALDPRVVDALVFCTKNPIPMVDHIEEMKDFRQFWFVTITPYGKDIEPNVPDKQKVIQAFQDISKQVGKDCMSWRYDPIFLSDKYDMAYHKRAFQKIVEALDGYTNQIVVSFIDLYEKTKKNFPEVKEVDEKTQIELTKAFVDIARAHGMTIRMCLEDESLGQYGVDVQGCMTKEVLNASLHIDLHPTQSLKTREGCDCLLGNDIGVYNTCGHLCRYCYANYSNDLVKENMTKHDPNSPLLIGHLEKDDIVRKSKQVSFLSSQLQLDI